MHKLEDLLGAVKVNLSKQDSENIRKILAQTAGGRYSEARLKLVQQDY